MFDENENTVMIPTFAAGSFFADRYRIEGLLGTGAMGRVYEATEVHSERRVALKVLHAEQIADEESMARFRREAEVLASIGHPSIVEIYTFHQSPEGIPYLAMELLEGVTLKTRLQSGRFEDPRELQEIVDGLAGALLAAHERGVVHRDIKPDNVFLPATGVPRAKLVDVGLSRMQKQDKTLTRSGMILGTPRYMAPEQIRDASKAGPRGDLYALGVIIYECLAGRSPYPAEDYGQLLGCLMEGRVTPLEEVRPDLRGLSAFMRQALAHDPEQRFRDGGQLADAYGAAIGRPSRRLEIARQAPRKPERSGRQRVPSQSLIHSKSSTLAFDAAAAMKALDARGRGSLPGAPASESGERAAQPAPPPGVEPAPPAGGPFTELDPTDPMGEGEMARVALGAPGPAGLEPPTTGPPPPPEGKTLDHDLPLEGFQAQGGDTLFLGQGAPLPPLPPEATTSELPAPRPSAAPSRPAPGRRKGRGYGLILFLVALLLVVIVSAVGGFALRAYLRGELEIPGLTGG